MLEHANAFLRLQRVIVFGVFIIVLFHRSSLHRHAGSILVNYKFLVNPRCICKRVHGPGSPILCKCVETMCDRGLIYGSCSAGERSELATHPNMATNSSKLPCRENRQLKCAILGIYVLCKRKCCPWTSELCLREKSLVWHPRQTESWRAAECDELLPIPIPNGATLVGRPLLR